MKKNILLIDCENNKKTYFYLENFKDKEFISTNKGNIKIEDIQNCNWGGIVRTHKGYAYRISPVNLSEYVLYGIKRETQVIYPKDASYICFSLGLKNGYKVFECGSGSGALTMFMANCVRDEGVVISYEKREKFLKLTELNVKRMGLENFVSLKLKDLYKEDIDEFDFDAAFIDTREPWKLIGKVEKKLKSGRKLGILVPTVNQIIEVLKEFENRNFYNISVEEILIRSYKTIHERIRPEDRMVAHTGYLIFANKGC